ncbi:MAG: DUF3795 domain-containing protein [Candidatus Cloacimonetes bacterium]|nr:DUF3795 domain-containing protein [Candidatus Cloacimonadota bacterium]
MTKILSACGLDCPGCECFVATRDNNDEQRRDIAVRWSKTYEAELTAQDINCEGCMSKGVRFGWCSQCPIRACVVGKGYASCAECADFPCATNSFIYEHVPSAKATIESMRGN